MALIAHYPLTENTYDSSGKNVLLTDSGGSTVITDGKIGKGRRKTAGAFTLNLSTIPQNCSISLWFKHNGSVWGSEALFGTRSGNTGFMLYRNGGDTAGLYRVYFYYVNTEGAVVGYNTWPVITGFTQDRWYHVTLVRTSTGRMRIYRDGVLYLSLNPPSDFKEWHNNGRNLSFHGSGGSYTGGDMSLNDLRVYDHALSDKEVKELAKAKVLHYKFDEHEEPTENILPIAARSNSGGVSRHWSAVILPNNKEKGLNSFKVTTTISSQQDGFIAGSQSLTLVEGRTYSYSALVWIPLGERVRFGMRQRVGGSSNYNIEVYGEGEWQKISHSFVCGDNNTSQALQGTQSTSFDKQWSFWVRELQVEENSSPTPFVNGERLGRVRDSSGFGNDGTVAIATAPSWSEDSPVGRGSMEFDGGNYISTTGMSLDGISDFTLSAWFKWDGRNGGSDGRNYIIQNNNSAYYPLSLEIYPPTREVGTWYHLSSGGGVIRGGVVTVGKWHNVSTTFSRKDNLQNLYLDGVLVASKSDIPLGNLYPAGDGFYIGTFRQLNNRWMNGNISDVRIYATALTPEDILELYQTRASVDNLGNLFVQEIDEVTDTGKEVDNRGVARFKEFNEVGGENKMTIKNDGTVYVNEIMEA